MYRRFLLALALIAVCNGLSSADEAEIQTNTVAYADGELQFEGFVAIPDSADKDNPKPAVLVVHQWMGLTDYEKSRCQQLAKLGYVAFALDIYGKGVRPANPKEAGAQSSKYKSDRDLYRSRLTLGLEQLLKQTGVDQNNVAAIGYCFGGTGVLELARSGAKVNGVVSFHGGLDSPNPADGENIQCKILVCHGADDPFVPAKGIEAMKAEFDAAKVDWQMISYSGAVHAFTQPMAGDDPSKGAAYQAAADRRSWAQMQVFFDELFGE
ncbi:dienelactone hydrolase family protein [Mariniblastus fucicola]|uniref:Dienelactone hydrolase family protein n=1 Tax=Mariniblastus fucicola TaxID=980251 RepID=A0A5B9P7B3_9BACT|nr:dienelactone hydrolase family protein [Mariniblastus fucicola]QEG22214.1 Dienelactone hydrolase family protein [Mariniblastus fucicola]